MSRVSMRMRWDSVRSRLRDRGGPSGLERSGDRDRDVHHRYDYLYIPVNVTEDMCVPKLPATWVKYI